jgi:hypothetical protein
MAVAVSTFLEDAMNSFILFILGHLQGCTISLFDTFSVDMEDVVVNIDIDFYFQVSSHSLLVTVTAKSKACKCTY